MERSSPLAAMQPSSHPFGHWNFRSDAPTSYAQFPGATDFGPNSFNFRDLSMKKSSSDYFSLKPVRGSSPTASLAADLSQNFHIDQSPQLPTPRRSLFSSNHLFGTLNGREGMTTPPIPSSSPGPGNDSMDISPLPHKAPFHVMTHIEVQSPTPETTPNEPMPLYNDSIPESPLNGARTTVITERRKSIFLRPSLTRTKGFSTNTVSFKSGGMGSQLPAFKFGNGSRLSTSASMSLSECFVDSPPQDRKMSFNSPPLSVMGPPRSKQPFVSMCGSLRNNGSPAAAVSRKQSAPVARPRKVFRRSLSMFEHPGEVMKQEKTELFPSGGLLSVMDVDDSQQLQLPHFMADQESLPRITKETMITILNGYYNQHYDQSYIVDCRFEYEYKGGHIDGAVNFNDKEELTSKLFESSSPNRTLLIFHCEYSAHRAPLMAKHVRHQDRAANAHQYPKLTYPEVYILDGGYSSFFVDHRARCFPQNYVEMAAKEHQTACERGLGRMKQQRGKLMRAQTFAFGQHPHQIQQQMEDSPTALGRPCDDMMMGTGVSFDQHLDPMRSHARRMASY
ncbi:MAG: cell division cycle- protein [Pleopsidium flavum]|nr:MAG: cell division cycle- protein [Pleopsidium flavum]